MHRCQPPKPRKTGSFQPKGSLQHVPAAAAARELSALLRAPDGPPNRRLGNFFWGEGLEGLGV